MNIPRFDYRQQYQNIKAEILRAVDEVLESGNLILGPRVRAFEEKMCAFLGTSGYGVGVGNGTDAIAIALRALDVGPGDEVITVSNTAVATASAIRMAGATPIFCDIDPETLLMDVRDAEARITSRTRALIPVHLFGNAVDMVAVTRLAARYGLMVVEDCAQSCGTMFHDRATGTWGDIGCFSFYPTKNLGAFGDGGFCFTRDPAMGGLMRQLRSYGCDSQGNAIREGVNSRLDELQAAVLEIKLRYLPDYLRKRREVGRAYLQYLAPEAYVPRTTRGAEHSYHHFVVRCEDRERVIARLAASGFEHGIHYPKPIHLMDAYRRWGAGSDSLPVTQASAHQVLSLPCFPELPIDSVREVCRVVNSAVARPLGDLASLSEQSAVAESVR